MAAHNDPIKGDCPKLPCPFGCQETFSHEHQLSTVVVHLNTLLGKVQGQAAEVDNIPRDSIQPDILVQRVEAMEGKVTEMTEKVETQRLELARFDRQGSVDSVDQRQCYVFFYNIFREGPILFFFIFRNLSFHFSLTILYTYLSLESSGSQVPIMRAYLLHASVLTPIDY